VNSSNELTEIWHFLERQEIRLIELDRRIAALLEVLKTNAQFFDSYRTTYEQLGRSNLILQQEKTIHEIDEKLRKLSSVV
jgi:hypothetical protein